MFYNCFTNNGYSKGCYTQTPPKRRWYFQHKIRVTHNRKTAYIATPHQVNKKQLDRNYEIKDSAVKKVVIDLVTAYNNILLLIESKLAGMDAKALAEYLEKQKITRDKESQIDFIDFSRHYIKMTLKQGGLLNASISLVFAIAKALDIKPTQLLE
jgi:hypothetical protein